MKVYYDDHYQRMPVEPWDVMDCFPNDVRFGYYYGNYVKYILRADYKGERDKDLVKAERYLHKLRDLTLPSEAVLQTVVKAIDANFIEALSQDETALLMLPLLGKYDLTERLLHKYQRSK